MKKITLKVKSALKIVKNKLADKIIKIFLNGLIIFLLIIVINLPNLSAQEKGELIKQVKVKNGAVIIDGKYIEPPYLIEARDNGIWINGVQAEKITKRKEQYRKIKEDRIKNEIYAEYFELGEEIGREQAREKIINNLMAGKEIKGVNLRKAKLKTSDEIEINTEEDNNFDIKLEVQPSASTEEHMFSRNLNKKYGLWYKATEKNKEEAFNDLMIFLEKQKNKGRIEDYKFEQDVLKVKYGSFWGMRSDWNHIWSASIEEKQIPPDNEADQLDKKDLQSTIEIISKALNGGYLEVYSQGYHKCAAPGGKSIIFELKKVMDNRNIDLDQREKMIKEVYKPASWEDKLLQEVLDNFNK